jgi:hypothetical protein
MVILHNSIHLSETIGIRPESLCPGIPNKKKGCGFHYQEVINTNENRNKK